MDQKQIVAKVKKLRDELGLSIMEIKKAVETIWSGVGFSSVSRVRSRCRTVVLSQ